MRTRAFPVAAAAALCALAGPVSAQIIATSIPKEFSTTTGKAVGEKKWAFHIMGAPLAKWKYGEIYIGPLAGDDAIGTVKATPNSDFLVAGEIALKAGANWTVGIGGWYNKIGPTTYGFNGRLLDFTDDVQFSADLDGNLKIVEGHAGIFYKDFGVQAGVVRSSGRIGTNVVLKTITVDGQSFTCADLLGAADCRSPVQTFTGNTTDWDVFGVYKHSWGGSYPVGVSLGAGVYGKQGTGDTPLRSASNAKVFTGFATMSIGVYKGLGVDASFWYIDKTDLGAELTSRGSVDKDTQSRLTVGLGYTFSR
jgi:hypothetical protein